MKPNIGIKPEDLAEVAKCMSSLLADEFVLYTKTRNAHWNIEGPDFHTMHLFFESQYTDLAEIIDGVAERIRSLGHYAPATLGSFLELTHLTEKLSHSNTGSGFLAELLEDHESIIILLRGYITLFEQKFHDLGTSDYVTGLMETHEKLAWMLRAHLK